MVLYYNRIMVQITGDHITSVILRVAQELTRLNDLGPTVSDLPTFVAASRARQESVSNPHLTEATDSESVATGTGTHYYSARSNGPHNDIYDWESLRAGTGTIPAVSEVHAAFHAS